MQLHIEFATPTKIDGASQWRANSGVLLMSRYEIQVLDSWENPTYADGQAARHLRSVAAAGQCFEKARRVANLRYFL